MNLDDRGDNSFCIPERYRAVINPFATVRELRQEIKNLDKVVRSWEKDGWSGEQIDVFLLVGQPPLWL